MSDALDTPHFHTRNEWSLDVLSGPNAGATLPLRDGRYRLGSALDNDIVFADPAIAEHQAEFCLDADGALLEIAAPGLAADGRALVAGAPIALRGPMHIAVGDTLLRLAPVAARPRRWPVWTASAVATVFLAGISIHLAGAGSRPNEALAAPVAARPAAPAPVAPDVAQSALRTQLSAVGIGPAVTLQHTAGAVVAAGHLTPDQRAAWMDAQMWFDGRYHGAVALVDQVAIAPLQTGPNFSIRAVSTGEPAFVIDSHGDRYMVGGVVDGGWTIAYIGQDRVVFRKDGRDVAETL